METKTKKTTTSTKKTTTTKTTKTMSPEERYQRICELAYFKAEKRGFANGSPEQDWLDAEREVNSIQ